MKTEKTVEERFEDWLSTQYDDDTVDNMLHRGEYNWYSCLITRRLYRGWCDENGFKRDRWSV